MTEIKITADNLDNISAKLDSLGTTLSVEEKGLLASVFQAAALHVHGDVEGFAFVGAGAGAGAGLNLGAAFQGVFGLVGGVAAGAGAGVGAGVGAGAGAGAGVGVGAGAGAGIQLPAVGANAGVYVFAV